MKTKHCIAFAALAVAALSGCAGQKEAKIGTGINLANLDTTAVPGNDFFRFACGGFNDSHPLTAEYSRYGSFEMLMEENQKQLKEMIEGFAGKENPAGSQGQKIGDLYSLAMDSVKLNSDGIAPIKPMLDKISAISDKNQIMQIKAELFNNGIGTYFSNYVYGDPKNSTLNIFQIAQGGINLGEKEYYLDTDENTTAIREQYKQYIVKLFTLAGFSEDEAKQKMADVMEVETAIAKASYSAVERRNPEANYHKMSYDELKKTFPALIGMLT